MSEITRSDVCIVACADAFRGARAGSTGRRPAESASVPSPQLLLFRVGLQLFEFQLLLRRRPCLDVQRAADVGPVAVANDRVDLFPGEVRVHNRRPPVDHHALVHA